MTVTITKAALGSRICRRWPTAHGWEPHDGIRARIAGSRAADKAIYSDGPPTSDDDTRLANSSRSHTTGYQFSVQPD